MTSNPKVDNFGGGKTGSANFAGTGVAAALLIAVSVTGGATVGAATGAGIAGLASASFVFAATFTTGALFFSSFFGSSFFGSLAAVVVVPILGILIVKTPGCAAAFVAGLAAGSAGATGLSAGFAAVATGFDAVIGDATGNCICFGSREALLPRSIPRVFT